MDPPFTRERLRGIKDDVEKHLHEQRIQTTVDALKTSILRLACGNRNCGQAVSYLEKNRAVITFAQIQYQRIPNTLTGEQQGHLPVDFTDIVARLRVIFPDSVFQVDPLNTYAIIDWS